MAISYAEAIRKLLNGTALTWENFGEHKSGSVILATTKQRRLFAFLLAQDATKVAQGDEALFGGLITAWNREDADPALEGRIQALTGRDEVWRLDRIQTSGFGGLNLFGGPEFDMWVNGENWCLEGQNGSGKTSLASAILWALTGKRIREQVGPIDEQGARFPVTDNEGKKIGEWPSIASYPSRAADLARTVEVWVRLTFKNTKGELATAARRILCPSTGEAFHEVKIDPPLLVAPELIETGLLMPARMAKVGFGDQSQSLYEAVKMLTGLDQLAAISEGSSQFTHAGRKFLRYGKDSGIEKFSTEFSENMAKAQIKATELNFSLPTARALDNNDVVPALAASATKASTEAGLHIATLRSEISAAIDIALPAGRLQIRNAVSAAHLTAGQATKNMAVVDAWTSLKQAVEHQPFMVLPAEIRIVRSKLDRALAWHERQMADSKFRLKALAAQSFVPQHEHSELSECPLCASALSSQDQRALASELAELQSNAEEAERKLGEVCRDLEAGLLARLPAGVKRHREFLSAMDPRESYAEAVLERFCNEPPFSDVLVGLASRIKIIVQRQKKLLPEFSFPEFDYAKSEPKSALDVRYRIHEVERLVSMVNWWSKNRERFRDAFLSIVAPKQSDGSYPQQSIEGELWVIEQALAKAEPLDELSLHLRSAANAAKKWMVIRKEQDVREDIAKALEPLKDLRLLVGAETGRSIAALSERMKAILDRIHLRERLIYEHASLGRKTVNVAGWFEPGMQIDAALVANTSWLRAILWAFILALREETIGVLNANPLPLMVLDDPQTSFDPRNKRKWAQEIARLANMERAEQQGVQLLLTTHEHQFFQCMVDHERLVCEPGLIGGVNKASSVATIVNGGCLDRVWREASDNNDDARARDYIADVRIYCEDLLKFMMRAEGPSIPGMTLDKLRARLKQLHDAQVAPFNRKAFSDLHITLTGGGKAVKLINESHHKDDESIGLAQAKDVKEFWEQKLRSQLHDAFAVYDKFESFYGEPRTFPWAKHLITFPRGFKDEVKALTFQKTGIAAAAKSATQAGDGLVTISEWETGKSIILPNHEVYQLAAGTLDPVAGIGDILIVCNHAKVNPRNLVVAVFGERLLARRYNQIEAHPEIIVLTGQSVDPSGLPEPIIVSPESSQFRKIVGTVFAARALPFPAMNPNREFMELADTRVLTTILRGARLLQVKGRSAEPIALDGQFLITREATKTTDEVRALDGCPIVAIDEDGTRFFKRLRCSGQLAVLESLNPDGTTASELLSFDSSLGLPKLTHALEVIGVLFELPYS